MTDSSIKLPRPWPEELDSFAAKIGSDKNLTQGPGGNISFKSNGILWVKASGTHLGEALNTEIFVPVDLAEALSNLRNGLEKTNSISNLDRNNLRPSIETLMHAQIRAPIVAHVHSLGAMTLAIQRNQSELIRQCEHIARIVSVPYARPGLELSREIEKVYDSKANGLLLGNHGLTVWAEDWQDCYDLITNLENYWTISHSELSHSSNMWSEILINGIVFPDEVVFLGRNPFKKILNANSAKELLTDIALENLDKSPWLRDLVDILEKVVRSISDERNVNYLSQAEIDSLQNWEAEKYRLQKNE